MVKLTDDTFTSYIQTNESVVVKFGADWCMPCVRMKPVFQALDSKYNVQFAEVDIDLSKQIVSQNHIVSVPTIVVYKNGEEVNRITGAKSQKAIEEELYFD